MDGFDIILLCTGYGTEKPLKGHFSGEYWDQDSYEKLRDQDSNQKIVIGQGDGALIEACSLVYSDMRETSAEIPKGILGYLNTTIHMRNLKRLEFECQETQRHLTLTNAKVSERKAADKSYFDRIYDYAKREIVDRNPQLLEFYSTRTVDLVGLNHIPFSFTNTQPIVRLLTAIAIAANRINTIKYQAKTRLTSHQNS